MERLKKQKQNQHINWAKLQICRKDNRWYICANDWKISLAVKLSCNRDRCNYQLHFKYLNKPLTQFSQIQKSSLMTNCLNYGFSLVSDHFTRHLKPRGFLQRWQENIKKNKTKQNTVLLIIKPVSPFLDLHRPGCKGYLRTFLTAFPNNQ